MHCEFCSTWIPDRNSRVDTSTDEALKVIDQLSRLKTKMIHFSGGEPTLREDLPVLINVARQKRMLVLLTTNGSMPAHKLKNIFRADLIRVSIDGTEKYHDDLRKAPGAYKKALETLKTLKSAGLRPQMTTVFTQNTSYVMLKELAETCKALKIQMAIGIISKNLYNLPNNIEAFPSSDTLTNLFDRYIRAIRDLRNRYANTIVNPEPLLTIIRSGGLNIFGCRAMDIAISVKNDGSITMPCTAFALTQEKSDLKDIYYSIKAKGIRDMQGRFPQCRGCYVKCMSSASALLKIKGLMTIIDSYVRNLL